MRCIYCDSEADRYCDFVLGFTDADGDGLYAFDGTHTIERCDSPLCAAHGKHVGNFFACGMAGFSDSIDHCCGHQADEWWGPIEDASRWRIKHQSKAAGLRLVP